MSVALGLGAASHITNIVGEDLGQTLFGVAGVIAASASNTNVNKAAALALSRRVNDLVAVIIAHLEERQAEQVDDEWDRGLREFYSVLVETQDLLQDQERRNYLARMIYRERDADALRAMSCRIDDSFAVLLLRARIRVQESATAVAQSLEASLGAINALQWPQTPSPETNAIPAPKEAAAPPALAAELFGRGLETQRVLDVLCRVSPSYVALLGGPGIGKTSLATAVLHAPAVLSHFGPRRYFVALDAANGRSSSLGLICDAFGVTASSRQDGEKALSTILRAGSSLLVLDNFESVWEAAEGRVDAETTLAFLASIDGLSLVVTLRGTERPNGVAWTRPFLPPLQPLSESAAKQAFLAIADVRDGDATLLDSLLRSLENVPLAVVLAASLAQYEPLGALVSRWDELRTAMLKRGDGRQRLNSLDISIQISIESPRMQQATLDAVSMLSLLSLLPRGVMDTDVHLCTSIDDPSRLVSALVQNALAVRGDDGRVRVLAPIREYVLATYPPTEHIAESLYLHYFGLADFISREGWAGTTPDLLATVSPEIENIDYVIRYALNHAHAPIPSARAAFYVCKLFFSCGVGSADLLPDALRVAREAHCDTLVAEILVLWAMMVWNGVLDGSPRVLYEEAQSFYKRAGDVGGIIDTTIRLADYLPPDEAVQVCEEMCTLAEAHALPRKMAQSLLHAVYAHERSGSFEKAIACAERALAALAPQGNGDDRLRGQTSMRIAEMHFGLGNMLVGITRMRDAIELLQSTNYRTGLGVARMVLAEVLLARGEPASAVELLQLGVQDLRAGGEAQKETSCLLTLAKAHLALSDDRAATRAADAAAKLLGADFNDGRSSQRVQALLATAEVAVWHRDYSEARAILGIAAVAARTPDRSLPMAHMLEMGSEVLDLVGQIEQVEGRMEEARTCFVVAALVFRHSGRLLDVVRMLTRLAEVVDDGTAEVLLGAVLLPLQRFGFRPLLANALLRSAHIALGRNQLPTALHRAGNALRYFEQTSDSRGCIRATGFLEGGRTVMEENHVQPARNRIYEM